MKTPDEYRKEMVRAEKPSPELPPTTTFVIDETVRGRHYAGTFQYEVPTLADQILIGQLKNKYLPDGGKADPQSAMLVEQICYLEITLKGDKPLWYKPFEFRESDLIAKLYLMGVAYANKFLGRDADGSAADDSDGGIDGSGDTPDDEGSLGEDLPSSDERPPVVIAHVSRTS